MNTYSKYCANVFLAKCEKKYEKGETIIVETKHGKENECVVHNLIYQKDGYFYYSITRLDGFNSKERAKRKIEQLKSWANNAEKRGEDWREKSNEGEEFLSLGEPIKVGHHSEKRHRALIHRNWKRMENAMEEFKKADEYRERTAYWESLSKEINLSMPESVEYFKYQLTEAKEYHQFLKDNPGERPHDMALAYAAKKVKDLKKKHEIAIKLWI